MHIVVGVQTWLGRRTSYYWDDFRLAAEVKHDGGCALYVYVDQTALVPFMFVEYNGLDAEPGSGRRYYLFTSQIGVPIRVEDDAARVVWRCEDRSLWSGASQPAQHHRDVAAFPWALPRSGNRAAQQPVPFLQPGTWPLRAV